MCERLTEAEKKECHQGQGCCVFKKRDTTPSYDKGGHKERSLENQPNHQKHWKKAND